MSSGTYPVKHTQPAIIHCPTDRTEGWGGAEREGEIGTGTGKGRKREREREKIRLVERDNVTPLVYMHVYLCVCMHAQVFLPQLQTYTLEVQSGENPIHAYPKPKQVYLLRTPKS